MKNKNSYMSIFAVILCLLFSGCELLNLLNTTLIDSTSGKTQKEKQNETQEEENNGSDNNSETQNEETQNDIFQFIVDEMNFARTKPVEYAEKRLEPILDPAKSSLRYQQYLADCIKEMKESTPPVNTLKLDRGGLSKAAQEWCELQGKHKKATDDNWIGHEGVSGLPESNRTWVQRIAQYCDASTLGENIAYGTYYKSDKENAEDIVRQLLIDDGVEGVGHRKSILGKKGNYNYAGVGYGSHNYFGNMCVIDLAGTTKDKKFVEFKPVLNPKNEYENELQFLYYDDNAELAEPLKESVEFSVDGWNVTINKAPAFYGEISFYANGQSYPSAVYDSYFQMWKFISGHFEDADGYNYDWYRMTPHFDSNLKEILSKVFTKIDSSIPLDRKNIDLVNDYYYAPVPLSKKAELTEYYTNYDWQSDTEFAEFVQWMKKHDIPQSKIDFYTTMARYPLQRGKKLPQLDKNLKISGADYTTINENFAGGMQLYFEKRKEEKRKLFNNTELPILLVHIKDKNGSTPDIENINFEEEKSKIENSFSKCGLKNKIQVYIKEIQMDYSAFEDGTGIYGNQFDCKWENILEEIKKTDSGLAQKFTDKNKSGMLRYFDTEEMNEKFGCINASRYYNFWHVMIALGYGNNHVDLFGSKMHAEDAVCNANDCSHEEAICPLCLYSFGIE